MEERGVCSTLLGLRNVMIGKNFAPETFVLKFSCADAICIWFYEILTSAWLLIYVVKTVKMDYLIDQFNRKSTRMCLLVSIASKLDGRWNFDFFSFTSLGLDLIENCKIFYVNLGSKDSAYISIRNFFIWEQQNKCWSYIWFFLRV